MELIGTILGYVVVLIYGGIVFFCFVFPTLEQKIIALSKQLKMQCEEERLFLNQCKKRKDCIIRNEWTQEDELLYKKRWVPEEDWEVNRQG